MSGRCQDITPSRPYPLQDHSSLIIQCPPHLASLRSPQPLLPIHPSLHPGAGPLVCPMRYCDPPDHQKYLSPKPRCPNPPLSTGSEQSCWVGASATRGHHCLTDVERCHLRPMACREAGGGNACLTKSGNLNKMNSKGPILCPDSPGTASTLPVAGTPPSARRLARDRSALPVRKGLCNNLNLICRSHEVLRGHADYQSHIF